MRSLGTRRAVQVAGAATIAVLALAGCSAGQTAETSILQSPISGLNTASPDGGLLIRNLQVVYNSPTGYAADANAPIVGSLFNQTHDSITVTISSAAAQSTGTADIVSAKQVGLTGPAPSTSENPPTGGGSTPTPPPSAGTSGEVSAPASAPSDQPTDSAGATPDAALQPAKVTIAPQSSVAFLAGGTTSLVASGLSGTLTPGGSLALTIESSTSSTPMTVLAPVEIPLSPASRGSAVPDENSEPQ